MCVRLLLQHGVRRDPVDFDGHTPLSLACASGEWQVVQAMVNDGANYNIPSHAPPMLHVADAACMQVLLEARADPNVIDSNCNTILHSVARKGDLDMALLLMSFGARVSARNVWGATPLHLATQGGWGDVVELLSLYTVRE